MRHTHTTHFSYRGVSLENEDTTNTFVTSATFVSGGNLGTSDGMTFDW